MSKRRAFASAINFSEIQILFRGTNKRFIVASSTTCITYNESSKALHRLLSTQSRESQVKTSRVRNFPLSLVRHSKTLTFPIPLLQTSLSGNFLAVCDKTNHLTSRQMLQDSLRRLEREGKLVHSSRRSF